MEVQEAQVEAEVEKGGIEEQVRWVSRRKRKKKQVKIRGK